jgi:hypothetical protein
MYGYFIHLLDMLVHEIDILRAPTITSGTGERAGALGWGPKIKDTRCDRRGYSQRGENRSNKKKINRVRAPLR